MHKYNFLIGQNWAQKRDWKSLWWIVGKFTPSLPFWLHSLFSYFFTGYESHEESCTFRDIFYFIYLLLRLRSFHYNQWCNFLNHFSNGRISNIPFFFWDSSLAVLLIIIIYLSFDCLTYLWNIFRKVNTT